MKRHSAVLFFHQFVVLACFAFAQEPTKVAEVNGLPISLAVVQHSLDKSFRVEPSPDVWNQRRPEVIKAGIEHCINREVILQHLQSGKSAVKEPQADRLLEEAKPKIEMRHSSLESYLESVNLTEQEYRHELIWSFAWRKYARAHVTEEHLEKQFKVRQKELDGTEVHVAQILWKETDAETVALANRIRNELESKELTWEAAVKEHSESASAKNGGDLGWIKFSGPMPRDFSKTAFDLEPGDFAVPFTSKYGTHLIYCKEVKAGSKTFGDVAVELRESETRRLFQLVAQRHRPKAKIEVFTTANGEGETDSRK